MAENTIRKIRWFWAWDDEKEENWLREMSLQGNHLKHVTFPAIYTFTPGEKKDYVYRLDYTQTMKKTDDYFNLFRDAGWFYLGDMNSWQYFRKENVGDQLPEIYTDNESKKVKYKRIIMLLAAFLPLLVVNIINTGNIAYHPAAVFLRGMTVVMLIFMGIGMIKLFLRIQELKKL